MNLFINAVSSEWQLILFNETRELLVSKDISVWWNESSRLTAIINEFLKKSNIDYKNLENIVVVSGPGSFTWVRAISLIVNTIAFSTWSKITDISFFDLFNVYPIVKASSKRDLFVKYSKTSNIEVVKNEEFIEYVEFNNLPEVYGDLTIDILPVNINLKTSIDYENIIKNIELKNKTRIDPLYIKKPSIS